MHKRTRRPPVVISNGPRIETPSIFHRKHRLTVRRHLLRSIVSGCDGPAGLSDPATSADRHLYEESDNVLAGHLEQALLDQHPRPHTHVARIWLRYSFQVADYFHSDRIAPIQQSLLERLSSNWMGHPCCRIVWDDSLETLIRKTYNRYVKSSALDFILSDGKTTGWTTAEHRLRLMANSCPRPTDRHKPMAVVQRAIGRKLRIHHFYGRKFVALWNKYIKPIEWHLCSRLTRDHWEMDELKQSWEQELVAAERQLVDGWQTIIKTVVKYAIRKKATLPSDGNVTVICRTLDALIALLLQEWRQETMTNFVDWLSGHRSDAQCPLVFVIHVTVKDGQLNFNPPVQEIRLAWSMFGDVLSVSAYKALHSSSVVFEWIKQLLMGQTEGQQQPRWDHVPFIRVKTPMEFLDAVQQKITDTFSEDEAVLISALEKFLVFSSFLRDDSLDLESCDNSEANFDMLKDRVIHYRQILERIEADLPCTLSVGRRYLVQMSGLKSVLKNKIASIVDRLLERFSDSFTLSASRICKDYAEYADMALTVPQTTAQWIRQRDQVTHLVADTLPAADQRILKILRCYLFMCDQMKVKESHSALAREVIMWKRRMNASQVEHGRLLRRKRTELEDALKTKRDKVVENVTVYGNIMDSFQKMGDLEALSTYVAQARSLLYRLEEAITNVAGINQEEAHFEWEVTQYPTLAQVRERLTPFLNFFEMSSSFLTQQQQWLDSRLGSFDPDAIVRETEQFAASLSTVEEQLPDISDVRHLLGQVETKLRDFNKVLPLIRTLGNPALRERHWEQIWDTVGVRLSSEAATSLQQLLALQLNEHLKKIEVISNSATQEMALENSLLRMKNQWTLVFLPVENYRVGEGKVLGKVDSIQLLVEDHMMETQIMRRSPYVKPFEKDAKEWEQQLNDLQVLLEQCVYIQERWCSLEPLLTSPDVLSIAPEEARKFSAIDKNWRDVLALIGQSKQVFSLLYAERMNERLNACIMQVQMLEKNLQNLMENKRLQYPRFFLLAEDELKRLLSLSRDPHKFATCLWRLYEGVHDLEFTAENDVTHVVSANGERLMLKEPVSYTKCKGQLDKFLNQLESTLKQTLSQVILDTLKDFDETDFGPLLSAPSQITILAALVYCTGKIDAAFETGKLSEDVSVKLDTFLNGLRRSLDASPDGRVHRLTAESVTLMALYYRDLLRDLSSTDDPAAAVLAWESCFKFRWIDNRIQIHLLDMSLDYGMEYIGLPPRMISYTDAKRIGLTVTNALSHHLTGILVGEPRSELLESLSHCLGQRLIRYDCSGRVASGDILRHIRGATTCGVWLCYHRLDALDQSTLSYMTSLLVQLQNMASTTPPWLELSSADSGLPQYGVFALTDSTDHRHLFDPNLKRTTNLSLPDVDALAQILFPGPWETVIRFLDSCRADQAEEEEKAGTSSDHSAAIETLKQIFAVSRRSSLSVALNSWQSARLPVARGLSGTKPVAIPEEARGTQPTGQGQQQPRTWSPEDWDKDPVIQSCQAACQNLRLHFTEEIRWKLYNLSEAFKHAALPVLLYGPRLSGKSSLLKILVESHRLAGQQGNQQKSYRPIVVERICIGAYTQESLMNNASQSVIPQLVQRSVPEKELLVVLIGPWLDGVQDVLLEALSTDGRGVLSLPSTEQMTIPPHVHWVFEMGSIRDVTPSHVAQCRLIHLDGQRHLSWSSLVQSWLTTLPAILQFLQPLISLLLPAVLDYVDSLDEWARTATGFHPIKSVRHFLTIVRSLTDPSAEAVGKKQAALDPELRTQLQASVIFAMLWTVAVPAYVHDKSEFHQFFHQELDKAVQNAHLFPSAKPPKTISEADVGEGGPVTTSATVFDYRWMAQPGADGVHRIWQLWSEELRTLPSLSREIPVNELFIATADSIRSHHLMSLFIQCAIPCVLIGPRSAGKTALARHYLRTRLNKVTHQVIIVNASKGLDARTAQRVLMGQMERRRKSVYGPTLGKKAVIFFDDMQTETMNSKTCNRIDMLLRQCIEHGQVFDGLEGGPSNLIDIDFVATTRFWDDDGADDDDSEDGPIKRPEQPDEILQSFAPIITEPPSLETASNILYRMLMWHLDARGFAKEFDAIMDDMINASMGLYKLLIQCPVLASFPSRSGCRWNLRDLMRCIHGLLLSVPETIEDVGAMKRLWLHEACRVYSDRLPLLEPVAMVTRFVEQSCETHFQATVSDLFAQMDMVELSDLAEMNINTIFFCDFSDPKSESRSYVEVMDMEHLTRVVNGYVTEYNNMNKRPMHYLNIFRHLMRTMTKASRVLKQPSGHLILVGPKGVGRHTLAKLAGHASDCTVTQHEPMGGASDWNVNDWTASFKLALTAAADEDKRSIFICSDVEFEREECRSLINHVVSHGDLMYLFESKERHEIVEQMRAIDLQKEKTLQTDGSPASLKAMFETRMWEQIRIVIILSCEQYNQRILDECPQVASACQVVWIHPWPSDAVADVASNCFKDIELDNEQKTWLIAVIQLIQQSMDQRLTGTPRCQRYGLMMDFLNVAVALTRNFKQEFKCRQELCSQAVDKLKLAAERVVQMETVAQEWKDSLSGLKSSSDRANVNSPGPGISSGDKAVRTERDVEMISCQIDRAKDLLSSLSEYQERWSGQVASLEDRIRCCQTDCTLTAAALVYGAEMKESSRNEMFRQWTRECRALPTNGSVQLPADVPAGASTVITTATEDYLSLLEPEVREVEAAWIMANLARDGHCIRSGVSLRHIQRVPLLIDPHNIAERWIDALNATKENRPTYLHMSAPDYLEQLAGALQLGTVVVIDITQTEMDPAILPLILKQTFNQGSSNYVKLGVDVVEYANEFQLYLRTQTPASEVDLQLRLSVTIVDLTLEQAGINDTLVSALVNSERPDTEEKIQLCKQNSELRIQLDETEQSLLNILSQSDVDWIENDAVITSLLPSITQSKLLKEKLDVVLQTRERMEIQRQSFAPTARLAVHILSCLWRMETLYPKSRRLRFPLSVFADSVVACLEDGEGDADDFDSGASTARKLAGRLFNRKLKAGMDRIQRLLAAMLLSYCVACSEKLCPHSFVQLLATGSIRNALRVSSGVGSSSDDDPMMAPDPSWTEWVEHVRHEENRWCLASSVDQMAYGFLKMGHKVEFTDYVASLADVSSVTPLLLVVESGVDLLAVISRLCREFDFPEDRVRFSAVAGLTTLNWVEVEDCVRRGNWLVLQGFGYLKSMVNNVRTLLEHLTADNISAEFKLFILWDTVDPDGSDEDHDSQPVKHLPIPRLLSENSRSIYIEHVHTFEDCIQEFMRSTDFDRLMNDPLRACANYPLKVKTAALLLVLRVVVWDQWDSLIPLIELWQTSKQIISLISGKNHDWRATFHQVSAGNLEGHVPADRRQEFVHRYLTDLADSIRGSWNQAVRHLIDSWSSTTPTTSIDLPCISEWLIDPANERRRQTRLSERLWRALVRGYGHSPGASDSDDMHFSSDDEEEDSPTTA